MKIYAIADALIDEKMVVAGLAPLAEDHELEIGSWCTHSVEELQLINLKVEQDGANAVEISDDIVEKIGQADVVLTQFCPIGRTAIEAASNLKIIGVLRGGTENVDHDAAKERGIAVVNTPGRNAQAVAEFTVGLILAETRNIARTHTAMRDGIWLKDFPNAGQIPEIDGRTVGIVGAGEIGSLVMRFLTGMGAKCQFYDPMVDESPYGQKVDELAELVREADVLSLHARLSKETYHMISADLIRSMKPTAVFINTARSGLVDEEALIAALHDNSIMGAAIDTFDVEPLDDNSPWLELNNVTLTSHLAGSTVDAFRKSPLLILPRILQEIEKYN